MSSHPSSFSRDCKQSCPIVKLAINLQPPPLNSNDSYDIKPRNVRVVVLLRLTQAAVSLEGVAAYKASRNVSLPTFTPEACT